MVTTSHELHEISLYVETIEAVEEVDYPIDTDILKNEVLEDDNIDTERIIFAYVTDVDQFHNRMKERFDREDAARIVPIKEASEGNLTFITLYVEETRQERGYEPVVEFENLDSDDYRKLDEELMANGMRPITKDMYEDLQQLEFISPAMPETLDEMGSE
jgi:hypothetical protein